MYLMTKCVLEKLGISLRRTINNDDGTNNKAHYNQQVC